MAHKDIASDSHDVAQQTGALTCAQLPASVYNHTTTTFTSISPDIYSHNDFHTTDLAPAVNQEGSSPNDQVQDAAASSTTTFDEGIQPGVGPSSFGRYALLFHKLMLASVTPDQYQSAAREEYGDPFATALLEAAAMSDTECEGCREPAIGKIATSGESIDPGTIYSDRRDSLLTANDLKVEPTAASVLFGTYELLEQVLLQSDNATILRLQRTNKTWDHVINRSQALQKKLFFQPEVPHHGRSKRKLRWNPLLLQKDAQSLFRRDERRVGQYGREEYFYLVEVQSRPEFAFISVPGNYTKHRPVESWRRMLLVQGCKHTAKLSIYGAAGTVWGAVTKMGQVQPPS